MRYTYMVLLVDFLITGIDSTICTDKADLGGFTNVLAMCRSGTLTAERVVVDTYDTGVLDLDRCQCTVSLSGDITGPINVQISAYTGTVPTPGCGSRLSFNRRPSNTYTEYRCQQIRGDIISNFTTIERLYITLSRVVANVQWQSGYCISIKPGVTVTCEAPRILPTSSTTRATTTATTTTSSPPQSTTTPPTTLMTTTDDVTTGYCNCDQTAFPLVTVVLIVVTLLVGVLVTVANVILYKRRLALVTELNASTHGMTSSDAVHYDSIDQSRVEPPNTYEEMSTRQTYVNTAMET